METRFLGAMTPETADIAIKAAATVLREGGLVAMPTETVYGLAADALNPLAVAGIFAAKGRPQDNPLIVHIAREEEMERLVRRITPEAVILMEAFWPGPLTIILPKSDIIPDITSGGLDTVAIRMPSHPVALAIIQESGTAVAAPSANRSGSPSPTTALHCLADLDGRVDLIVDAGPCAVGVESTVVTLAAGVPRLLRPGGVTLEQLQEALGDMEVDPAVEHMADEDQPPSSPGMKYKHYSPKAKVTLVQGTFEAFVRYAGEQKTPGTWALVFEGEEVGLPLPSLAYGAEDSPEQQAQSIFATLRRLDDEGAARVIVRAPSRKGLGLAVYNRLIRASGFEVVTLCD